MSDSKMTDAKAQAAKLLELSTKISKRVQIVNVWIAEMIIRRDANLVEFPGEVAVNFHYKVTGVRSDEGTELRAFVSFKTVGTYEGIKPPAEVFLVEGSYVVEYLLQPNEDLTAENIDAFCKFNGVYNAWPYWREFVQSSVGRMGLPNVVLPVMTVSTLLRAYEEQIAEASAKSGNALPTEQRQRPVSDTPIEE